MNWSRPSAGMESGDCVTYEARERRLLTRSTGCLDGTPILENLAVLIQSSCVLTLHSRSFTLGRLAEPSLPP